MPSVSVSVRGGRIVVSVPGRRGLPGTSGWTPMLAVVTDGARRVHQVVDYTGGTGTKPATGLYVGPAGLVGNIADAVDIGASGGGGAVTSVAGRSGDVVLEKADVGLSNVDNTSDINKPVSTAQAAADAAVGATAAAALAAHVVESNPHPVYATTTQLSTGLAGKSNTGHTHSPSEVGADPSGSAAAAQAAAISAAATDATAKAYAVQEAAALELAAHVAEPNPHAGSVGGTLGTNDNALTRADGTGGRTAQGSNVLLDDAANLIASNWTVASAVFSSRNYAMFGALAPNAAVILRPTGTGFVSAHVPDGTAAGGSLRGQNATDLQSIRETSNQVAGGGWSALVGGYSNRAAGIGSAVVGGAYCEALSDYTTAFGYRGKTGVWAQLAFSGNGSGWGQGSLLTASIATANNTPTDLVTDGGTWWRWITVPPNSAGILDVMLVGRTNTAGGAWASCRRQVSWWRGATAASTVLSAVDTIGTDRGSNGGAWPVGWTPPTITADTTNGGILISPAGAAATNVRWHAVLKWSEVTF